MLSCESNFQLSNNKNFGSLLCGIIKDQFDHYKMGNLWFLSLTLDDFLKLPGDPKNFPTNKRKTGSRAKSPVRPSGSKPSSRRSSTVTASSRTTRSSSPKKKKKVGENETEKKEKDRNQKENTLSEPYLTYYF